MRLVGFYLFLLAAFNARAEWWSFRGPGGNGVAEGKQFPPSVWSAEQNVAWKAEVPGRGHSSPVILRDRIFLTTSVEGNAIPGHNALPHTMNGKPFVHPDATAGDREVTLKTLCYDRDSGRLLWERTVYTGAVYDSRHSFNTYASPTPVTDGRNVYVSFESQGIYAFDARGKALWKASLGGVAKFGLGAGTSPVIAGGNLVIVADEDEGKNSFIYSLSTKTGEVIWKAKRDASANWSTPIVVRHGGREMVIVSATEHVIAYDVSNGKELWRAPGTSSTSTSSPVAGRGFVFPNGFMPNKKVFAVRVDPAAAERVAWTYEKGTAYIPSPILYRDLLYAMAGNGALTALEADTGKLVYESKRVPTPGRFTASPIAFDGKLFLTNEDGDTFVIRAGRDHEVLGTNSIGEPVFASLAVDGDSLYIRGAKRLFRVRRSVAPQ